MAFNIQQINPLDLQPSVGIGVSLPFSSNTVFTTTYTTQEALKANLINFFLTGQLERFFNPTFGAGVGAALFEQMTTDVTDQVESLIRSGVATWFPNVVITNLAVIRSPDTNTITVSLAYSVSMTNISDQLVINFEQ